jgi:hypothetical protein
MSFKENLIQKIKIDRLTRRVLATVGPLDSGRKVDREAMRQLLEMGPFEMQKERDLELYAYKSDTEEPYILVLDNDLSIYHTSAEDIGLRKSPTVKEMISIGNAIKILSDKDVVKSKKEDSVQTIRKDCIKPLDFNFSASDIESIAADGFGALQAGSGEQVETTLDLYVELLNYVKAPTFLKLKQYYICGKASQPTSDATTITPLVLYSSLSNNLRMIDEPIDSTDKESQELVYQVAEGSQKAAREGDGVISYLNEAALNQHLTAEDLKQRFLNPLS